MNTQKLSNLIENINIVEKQGSLNLDITGIAYDSRAVNSGSLFFAYKGIHKDGHTYITEAIKNGAAAIIHSTPLERYSPDITYLRVNNPRVSLSPVSAVFNNHPSKKLKVIGVTGTDGKSTTVSLIFQLLTALGKKTGFLSTVEYSANNGILKNPYRQSTPEAVEIHSILGEMVNNGCEYAVLEATSHGLSHRNNRLGDVFFNAAVLTNISHEHLEFHGTFEQYISDKANLFRFLNKGTEDENFGVINLNDPNHRFFLQASNIQTYTYSSTNNTADIYVTDIIEDIDGCSFTIHFKAERFPVHISLPAVYNIENTIAALITVKKLLNCQLRDIIPFIEHLKGVKGRMKHIRCGQPFSVIVDYAHSPGSFERFFPIVRKWVKGKLISVFGSAGERDVEKRSRQGNIAGKYSDIVVLTDEDPRGEDSVEILKEIAKGCSSKIEGKDLFLIPDRKDAVMKAFRLAEKGDAVLLLGKGHESTIIYSDKTITWDEISVAKSCLGILGYS